MSMTPPRSSKISLRKAVSAPSPTKMFLRQSRHTHEPSRKDYPSSLPFRERSSFFGNVCSLVKPPQFFIPSQNRSHLNDCEAIHSRSRVVQYHTHFTIRGLQPNPKKSLQGFCPSVAHIPLASCFSWLAEYVWWLDRNLENFFLERTVLALHFP